MSETPKLGFLRTVMGLLASLYADEELADVKFSVGKEKKEFVANRVILAAKSPVFKAMFYNSEMKESEESETIPLEDVTPEAFEFILRNIYTDDTANLSEYNIVNILSAANMYQIESIVELCENFLEIEANLSKTSACSIFAQTCGKFDRAAEHCLRFIVKHAEEVFDQPDRFVVFSSGCWESIFKEELVIRDEMKIFQAVLKWSERSTEDIDIISKVARYVSYPAMKIKQIVEISESELLNPSEIVEILQLKYLDKVEDGSFLKAGRCKGRPTMKSWDLDGLNMWLEAVGHPNISINGFKERRLKCLGSFYFRTQVQRDRREEICKEFDMLHKSSISLKYGGSVYLTTGVYNNQGYATSWTKRTVTAYDVTELHANNTVIRVDPAVNAGYGSSQYNFDITRVCACRECPDINQCQSFM
eukprot:911165_1